MNDTFLILRPLKKWIKAYETQLRQGQTSHEVIATTAKQSLEEGSAILRSLLGLPCIGNKVPSETRARPSLPSHPSGLVEILQSRRSQISNSSTPATSPAKKANEGLEQSLLNILRGGSSRSVVYDQCQPQQQHSSSGVAPHINNATSMNLHPYPLQELTKTSSMEPFSSRRETVLNSFKETPIQLRQQPLPPTLTSENSMPHKYSLLKLLQEPFPRSHEPDSTVVHNAVPSTVQEEKIESFVSRSNKFDRERLHSAKVDDTHGSLSSKSSKSHIANQYRPYAEGTSSDREGFWLSKQL